MRNAATGALCAIASLKLRTCIKHSAAVDFLQSYKRGTSDEAFCH
jgi:hypothetical protein